MSIRGASYRQSRIGINALCAGLLLALAIAVFAAPRGSAAPPTRTDSPSPEQPGQGFAPLSAPSKRIKVPQEKKAERIPGHYIVVLEDTVNHPGAVAEAQTEKRGGNLGFVFRHATKGYSAELSKHAVELLRKNSNVRYVVPDYKVEAFSQTIPTGVQRSFATENEAADIDGEDERVNVDVAVIDTGIDYEHPDLNVVERTNCVPMDEKSTTKECIDDEGTDGSGHGTHVAGTIGALDNGEGVVGVAPGARLWAVRVLNSKGSASFSWVIAGVDWVTAHSSEIEVANMSLGGYYGGGPDPVAEAVEASIEAGVVYAIAAGNEARDASSFTPARTPGAITVAALADYDGKPGGESSYTCKDRGPDDTVATFSNYGSVVDIAAPGVCIYSTLTIAGTAHGKEYGHLSGTSMASPHVAGAAALLASESNPSSKGDVEAIRDQLVEEAALDFDFTSPGPSSPLLYLGSKPLTGTGISTGGVESLKAQSVVLTGAIAPRGPETSYQFEYGPDTSYGNVLPVSPKSIAAGAGFTRVSEALSGLDSNTVYHYRLVASNTSGTHNGQDRTFETAQLAYTNTAEKVTDNTATLTGLLYVKYWPDNTETSYSFEYGLTTSYGHSVSAEVDIREDEDKKWEFIRRQREHYEEFGYENVVAELSSLESTTVYHYRLVATNSNGTFYGEDHRFRTAVWPPSTEPTIPSDRNLKNLVCVSADYCMAIAERDEKAASWDGEEWTKLTTPGTSWEGGIVGLTCVSEDACFAVGHNGISINSEVSNFTKKPFAMRWDGEDWAPLPEPPLPSPGYAGELTGIECALASSCLVVGTYYVPFEGGIKSEYLGLHWDGSEWTSFPMPEAPVVPFADARLTDLACPTASICFAVGIGGAETLQWNGSEWSEAANAPDGMYKISCGSATSCLTAGSARWGWNGKEWSMVPTDQFIKHGSFGTLWNLSCAKSWSCVAVGTYSPPWTLEEFPLVIRWDGLQWTSESIPLAATQERGLLFDVACTSAEHCLATGTMGFYEGPLLAKYDYEVAAPTAATNSATHLGTSEARLNGTIGGGGLPTTYQFEYDTAEYKTGEGPHGTKVPIAQKELGSTAASVEVSEAVVGLKAATVYHYRVVATNAEGTAYGKDETFSTWGSWSSQTTPNPALPPNPINKASLETVSCPSSSLCLAAGYDTNSGKGFGQRWTGSEWKADTYLKELPTNPRGIACPSTTYCAVVGYQGSGSSSTASAESWFYYAGYGWVTETQTVPQPEGGSYVKLNDVSCTSSSACTAVGSFDKENKAWTLAARWNGTSWSLQTTANPESGSAELLGVSCDSASSCTAVGKKGSETFAERWNGTSWSISSTPNPSGAADSRLEKVSCTSSSNCLAVGSYLKTEENNRRTLALRWNGTSWSVITSPNPSGNYGASLLDVTCTSSTSCTAVGRYVSATVSETESLATEEKTLVESWNGTEWAIQSSPNPEGKKLSKLLGVSCASSTNCKAVGSARKSLGEADTVTLGEDWNGTSWSLNSTPNPALPPNPINKASLETVSCPSSSLCLAAGYDTNSGKGFGQRWTGSEWKADTYLKELPTNPRGIACPSTTYCAVVGYQGSGSSSTASAESWFYYAGYGWVTETQTVPQPEGGSYVKLNDVSCTSSSACTAVGSFDKENKAWTLAARWNGTSWSLQTTANPESGSAELLGVSCDSASSCTAVGKKGNSETFAERWNGTSWSISSTPNPSGAADSRLEKVSCTSSSNCLAVGSYLKTEENNRRTLALRWNGTSWSVITSPNPSGNYGASLLDVTCTSSTSCTAVGRYVSATVSETESLATEEKTLVESWNGTEWAIQSSPNPEGKKLSKLLGVSCASSTNCKAVGSARKSLGEADTVTLGEGYE